MDGITHKKTAKDIQKKDFLIKSIQILVGLVFIFSGLVKLDDPLGFSYKLEEYFEVFHLPFLNGYALTFSLFFCNLESILGFALLFGVKAKRVVPSLLALILFFSFLTFYSAYFNKVTECGCFGDAIKLTPWQSFYKNIVLTLLILFLQFRVDKIQTIINQNFSFKALWICVLFTIGLGWYSVYYLPPIDFLPYKIGNHLPSLMEIPKGEVGDEYGINYTLKNKRTGIEKLISDKEYISSKIYLDSNWKYVKASDPILIKAGYQVPIKDLKITNEEGVDLTKEIIEHKGYTLLVVVYDLHHTNLEAFPFIRSTVEKLTKNNPNSLLVIGLTAGFKEDLKPFNKENGISFPVYFCDGVPLKSMVRSNPGIILLNNGTVIGKWSSHNIPSEEVLMNKLSNSLP